MKKVCFVIPRAYYLFNPSVTGAEDKVGGTQTQTYILSKSLAEDENIDVNFLVADFGQEKYEKIENVKIWKSFSFFDNIFKRTFYLLKTLKKINADTYILQSADIGVAFASMFIKIVLRKKFIYMLASDIEISKKLQKKYSGNITSYAMQWVYKRSDILTVQTNHQSKVFFYERKRKPNEIIRNIYTSNNKSIEKTVDNTILWVGRLAKIKNPEYFLNLAIKYPKKKFIMIAPIVMDYVAYGKKIQKQAKAIRNLTLINYVPKSEIEKYYNNAKIYVLSSDFEGFSNTMAEAMIANCAILTFNVNPDNVITNNNCGLYSEGKKDKFYENFDYIVKDINLINTMGKNGAEYIKANHKKEIIINKFKALL